VSPRKKPEGAVRSPKRLTLPDASTPIALPERLPLLPLRDVVVFPHATLPLFVGRSCSVAAVEAAVGEEKLFLAVAQQRPEVARPKPRDLHETGTLSRIVQLFRLPDGSLRILIEGLARARLTGLGESIGYLQTSFDLLDDEQVEEASVTSLSIEARREFRSYVKRNRRVAPEVALAIQGVQDPEMLSHKIAAHLQADVAQKQELLECAGPSTRLAALRSLLIADREQHRRETQASQRRTSRGAGELPESLWDDEDAQPGEGGSSCGLVDELDELTDAIEAAQMPPEVEERARRELHRLERMAPISPEATVSRSYIEWLTNLPWTFQTRDRRKLAKAKDILDEDHYGLCKVKERVLELISVLKLSREVRGPILCLAGPPGVGKTSVGRSIARALGRRFVRMSLGGVRDEAEIRGHRRTYIGSLPGRILQAMRRAGSVNPVILLDEVDKMGTDHRGDPAAALLEVLDPEQNVAFNDHYAEVDYDLSKVLFITTANQLHAIPEPLRDRMEIIRLPGYTELEKTQIAQRYLVPRQRKANGLRPADLEFTDAAVQFLIRGYTREAGVRALEQEIARVCRRAAKVKAGGDDAVLGPKPAGRGRPALQLKMTEKLLRKMLGAPRHEDVLPECESRVGIANGLAWTSTGGELLSIEVGAFAGRGKLLLTGQLGETMRESAQAALSYIRARHEALGLDPDFHQRLDLHVHVPEGAVPKDGPSAGVTIALAMVSVLTGIPTRADLAMTGEITLRGQVLTVGGLGEKLVAAKRVGLKTVVIPHGNRPQLQDIPKELLRGLSVETARTVDQILEKGLSAPVRDLRRTPQVDQPPLAA